MNIVPHPDIQVSRITKKNVHFSLEYSWSFSKQTFGFIYAINDQQFLVQGTMKTSILSWESIPNSLIRIFVESPSLL